MISGVGRPDDHPRLDLPDAREQLAGAVTALAPEREDGVAHLGRQALRTERVPDQVHADHQVDPVERHGGGGARSARPHRGREEVGRLLRVERRDDHPPAVRTVRGEPARDLHQDRHRGRVVVRARGTCGRR